MDLANFERIPKIFNEILLLSGTTRDCTENCYGSGNKRIGISEKKLCCPLYEYNGNCYDKCPPRTRPTSLTNKICIDFQNQ